MSSWLDPPQGLIAAGIINPAAIASQLGLVIDAKRDYGASGSSQSTTGTMAASSTTLTLAAAIDFVNGQGISVAGAGASGALLVTSIVSGAGTTTLTLATAASTAVSAVAVNHDDTAALVNAAAGAQGGSMIFPPAVYSASGGQGYIITGPVDLSGVNEVRGVWTGDRYGGRATPIIVKGATAGFVVKGADTKISQLSFIGDGATAQTGLHLSGVPGSSEAGLFILEDIYMEDFSGPGALALRMDMGTATLLPSDSWIRHCHFTHNTQDFVLICADTHIDSITVHGGNNTNVVGDNSAQQVNEQNIFFTNCDLQCNMQVYASQCTFTGGQITGPSGLTIETGGNANIVGCSITSGSFTNDGGNNGNTPIMYGGSARIWTLLATTTLTGTTAGTAVWVMDEQGTHKRFVCVLNGYQNSGTTAQVIDFPVGFTYQAAITGQSSSISGTSVTTSALTLPTSMTTAVSGVITVEGI